MAAAISAGVLVWRRGPSGPEFLLVHPGGPFWRGRDTAAWSIPKGLAAAGEDPWAAAAREFEEELGQPITGPGAPLPPCRLPGGKRVLAWLVEADLDLSNLRSNSFELEWPRGSGRRQAFPEVDAAAYVPARVALEKIHKGQRPLLEAAISRTAARARSRPAALPPGGS